MLNGVQRVILYKLPRRSRFGGGVGAKLSSIAECSNIPKSTVWRNLQKMVDLGIVEREDIPYKNHFVSRYSLTPRGVFMLEG